MTEHGDFSTWYEIWCDGSCYHNSKTLENQTMGLGILSIETNTLIPQAPIARRLAIEGPLGNHNMAEYLAIICALYDTYLIEGARRSSPNITPGVNEEVRQVTIHSDSQLVINQITGEYGTKTEDGKFLLEQVDSMLDVLQGIRVKVKFKWVPRGTDNQKIADWLSKIGNPYFKDIVPDENVAHQIEGPTPLEDMMLPAMYNELKKHFQWD
jgi:ribonuclease HI